MMIQDRHRNKYEGAIVTESTDLEPQFSNVEVLMGRHIIFGW